MYDNDYKIWCHMSKEGNKKERLLLGGKTERTLRGEVSGFQESSAFSEVGSWSMTCMLNWKSCLHCYFSGGLMLNALSIFTSSIFDFRK